MYELKKIGKVFTSKFVGNGPSSYKKRIYRAAISQRLRNTGRYQHLRGMCRFFVIMNNTGYFKIFFYLSNRRFIGPETS